MADVDQEQQWREITETYRHMTDDELFRMAGDVSNLVPIAQEVLQAVISERGLKVTLTEEASAGIHEPENDEDEKVDPRYLEERDEYEMVVVRRVYSQEEAELTKSILDANFVALCFGAEEVVEPKDFKESFTHGVDVKIHRLNSRRAHQALDAFAPLPEDEEEKEAEDKEYAIVCPKCHSQEIIFAAGDADEADKIITRKFNWTCSDCGHQWKDDGIVQAV